MNKKKSIHNALYNVNVVLYGLFILPWSIAAFFGLTYTVYMYIKNKTILERLCNTIPCPFMFPFLCIGILIFICEIIYLMEPAEDEDKDNIIKKFTKYEILFFRSIKFAIINHSKCRLHNKKLDFDTNIDNIKIDNPNALPILIELNDIDIPKYQNYNKCINKIKSLEPANEIDNNKQTQQLDYLNEQKRILKIQILSKTNQIKDIITNYKHQRFSNEYQLIKNEIDKL